MFKEHNITPSDFNVICAPITTLRTQKSDHNNGYFIVSGLWGTCFHRIATKRDRFEIIGNNNPKCPHTYTKIPSALAEKTYFVYVNYKAGFVINLPAGAIVVGMHEAQSAKLGGWWSQSVLIYCPTGEEPTVSETTIPFDTKTIRVHDGKKETPITVEKIMQGFDVRYIATNEEGYYNPKSTRPDRPINFPFTPKKNSLADVLQNARQARI